MKYKSCTRAFMLPVIMMILIASCQRRLIETDELLPVAYIPVKINWSNAGGASDIHKVSVRFFPKDGANAFDCYMETNVTEGEIRVPAGNYSVIVFNESIHDNWYNQVVFSDVNSYSNFSASVGVLTDGSKFPYYTPQSGERFIVEPLRLASWKLDDFEVTNNMILVSQGHRPTSALSAQEDSMFYALTKVMMRALTRAVTVEADVVNLVSAETIYMAIYGLATKVNMATAVTSQVPSTFLFILNERQFTDANRKDGKARNYPPFLCFGRTPAPESYKIGADVLLVSKEMYKPATPLLFDVTTQFIAGATPIKLPIAIDLPLIEGGIAIDNWGNDELHTVKQ